MLLQKPAHWPDLEGAGEHTEPLGGIVLPQLEILLFVSLKFPDRQNEPSEPRVSFP